MKRPLRGLFKEKRGTNWTREKGSGRVTVIGGGGVKMVPTDETVMRVGGMAQLPE